MEIQHISRLNRPISNTSNYNSQYVSQSFADIFKNIINETQDLRRVDMNNNILMATRDITNLHQPMIDMEKAELALQFTLQVRNKILDAYQEIMRMQI